MELKEILDKMKDKKAILNIHPSKVDPGIRSTFEGNQRAAKSELLSLENEYKKTAVKNSVLISITGAKAKEFVQKASGQVIGVNYKQVLEDLNLAMVNSRQPETFQQQSFLALLGELNRMKARYGISAMPMPQNNLQALGVIGMEMKEAIKTIIEANYQDQLYSASSRVLIGELALAGNFSGKKLPVFMYNVGQPDAYFLPSISKEVEINSEMNDDQVNEELKRIAESMKPKTKQTKQTKEEN